MYRLYIFTGVQLFQFFQFSVPIFQKIMYILFQFSVPILRKNIFLSVFFPVIPNEVAPLSTVLHWPEQLNVSNTGIWSSILTHTLYAFLTFLRCKCALNLLYLFTFHFLHTSLYFYKREKLGPWWRDFLKIKWMDDGVPLFMEIPIWWDN